MWLMLLFGQVDLPIEQEVRECIKFLSKVQNPEDVRMISFRSIPQKDRESRRKTMKFWLNNMSFESDIEDFHDVPGTEVVWFYLSDFGWNAEAWQACADRDPYYNEPDVPSELMIESRKYVGEYKFIMRADFLFRESVESDRSPTYYDLLFAKQRYASTKVIYHPGGDYLYPDGSVVRNVAKGNYKIPGFVDFPQNEKEWEKIFGLDKFEEFYKLSKINLKRGAIVDEGVSIVTLANRLIEKARGPIGSRYKTFDVKTTSGKRDFAEHLYFDFEFDAGELISQLPNGGQAYLLTLKDGKIVEVADNKIARDATDLKDTRVRNPGSCVVCHEKGIIEPKNLIDDLLKDGIDIHFRDKKKARGARAFFLNWEKELKADQERYSEFVKRTSGFEPAVNAAKFKEFRDWYDSPITVEQAALECGVTVEEFKLIAARSPRVRLLQLVRGQTIPRATWQGDINSRGMYREFMLLYRSRK